MRRLKLRNLTICLCMICVVAFSVATPIVRVSALAQPVEPELAPVFDTQIYQLTDYVEQSMTDPQRGILYLLLGAWAAAQAGTNDYELVDPYTTSDGVTGWLKSTGIQLYNSMLSLQGGNVYDPVTGTNLTPVLSGLVGYALGAAGLAKNYNSESDFLNDVNSQDHYFIPFDPVLQASINAYFGRSSGLWNWQFSTRPFDSLDYISTRATGSALVSYNTNVDTLSQPVVDFNELNNNNYSGVKSSTWGDIVLFYNTTTSYAFLYYSDGTRFENINVPCVYYHARDGVMRGTVYISRSGYDFSNSNMTFVELTNYLFTSTSTYLCSCSINDYRFRPIFNTLVKHVYVGADWATKQEIFNISDLNFENNDIQSYDQVPDNTLLDIKGLLTNILNNTDLLTVILNNLYDRSGTLITLPDIKVSISLPDNNPLPVNLNEISEIVDNTYLDLVKQRATQASETIGEYVAFWHNCDPEVVYVSLGAILIIAIGAFIGKWGHS